MDITPELATAIFWNSDAPIALGRRQGNAYCASYIPAQIGEDYGADCGFQPKPARRVSVVFAKGLVMILGQRWLFIHCGDHVIVPPFPEANLPYLAGMEPDDVRLPGDAG
jgi:hypothetical protein